MRELIDAMEDNWSSGRPPRASRNLPEVRPPNAFAHARSARASRVRAEQEPHAAGRVRVGDVLDRDPPLEVDQRLAGRRVSWSENASARASTGARELVGDHRRGRARPARSRAPRPAPRGGPSAPSRGASRSTSRATANIPNGATIASQSSPCGTSRWCTCAELVGDDQPRLGRREVVQQRVVEHDALRVPEPGDVGVGRGRAARGVHLVDLADVDARLAGQLEHVACAVWPSRQRRELVEQRVERRPGRRRS